MRIAEIFGLNWGDIQYRDGLVAVRAKLKGGKTRYVPVTPELAQEFGRYPVELDRNGFFLRTPVRSGSGSEWIRVSIRCWKMAGIEDFRFHDLRHTFASW